MRIRDLAMLTLLALLTLSGISHSVGSPEMLVGYSGEILVEDSVEGLGAKSIRTFSIDVLAQVSGEGIFPLKNPDEWFTHVNLTNSTAEFLYIENATVYNVRGAPAVSNVDTPPNLRVALVRDLLILISGGMVDSVHSISTLSKKVVFKGVENGNAMVSIGGFNLTALPIEELESWLLFLNESIDPKVSVVLLNSNGTYRAFSNVDDLSGNPVIFVPEDVGLEYPYSRVTIEVSGDQLILVGEGDPYLIETCDRIPAAEMVCLYSVGNLLLRVTDAGQRNFTLISKEFCDPCETTNASYVYREDVPEKATLSVPKEVFGCGSLPLTVSIEEDVERTVVLVEGLAAVLIRGGGTYKLEFPLELGEERREIRVHLTAKWSNLAYGTSESVVVRNPISVLPLNGSRIYLLEGRGHLALRLRNYCNFDLNAELVRLGVRKSDGEVFVLEYPVDLLLPAKSFVDISLPLSLPEGPYSANLSVTVKTPSEVGFTSKYGKTIEILSIGAPLVIDYSVSPDHLNKGDTVILTVQLKNSVPLENLLITVSPSEELLPVSETSKLIPILPLGGEKLLFRFRAREIGRAEVLIDVKYELPQGSVKGSLEEVVDLNIGGVVGEAEVLLKGPSSARIGEVVELLVGVEGTSGEVEIAFPPGVRLIESGGRIEDNKVRFKAPGRIPIKISFDRPGDFSIPSLIMVNGTTMLPYKVIRISVGGHREIDASSLRSNVADLRRRLRTLEETLEESKREEIDRLWKMLELAEDLIEKGSYDEAEKVLRILEDDLKELEVSRSRSLDETFSKLGMILAGLGALSLVVFLLWMVSRSRERR